MEEPMNFSSGIKEEYAPYVSDTYTLDSEHNAMPNQTTFLEVLFADSPPPHESESPPAKRKRKESRKNKQVWSPSPEPPSVDPLAPDSPIEYDPILTENSVLHPLEHPDEESDISTKELTDFSSDSEKECSLDISDDCTSDSEDIPAYLLHDTNKPKRCWKKRSGRNKRSEPPMTVILQEDFDPVPVESHSPSEGESPLEVSKEQHWIRVNPPEPAMDIRKKFLVSNPGPTCETFDSPIAYFYLFFTAAMWDLIVNETNKFARRKINAMRRSGLLSEHSRTSKWVDVTVEEMKRYIGLLLAMGLTQRKGLTQYWSSRPTLHIPLFNRTMSLRRFQLITAMFYPSSSVREPKSKVGHTPWLKIHDFLEMMNNSFKSYFVPSQKICIVESTVGMKNHTDFIQYLPNKGFSKHGIKKFDLCDSDTGYVLQSVLFSSKDFLSEMTDPFSNKVVANLLGDTGLLDKGYHLLTNNFYTKIALARWLFTRNTYLTATINMKWSREVSKILCGTRLDVGQSLYYRSRIEPSGSVLLLKFRERETRKPIHLISTAVHAEDTRTVAKSGCKYIKPCVTQVYNEHLGGVISRNKSNYNVSCTRTTKSKLWMKIVHNFIDMALLNAYILYVHNAKHVTPMARFNFIDNIIEHLCFSSNVGLPLTLQPPIASPSKDKPGPRHEIVSLASGQSLACAVCSLRGITRTGTYWCPTCKQGVHKFCRTGMHHVPCTLPGHEIVSLPSGHKLTCVVCSLRGIKRKGTYWCPTCKQGVHKFCKAEMQHVPFRRPGRVRQQEAE